ncbi:MAG: hypothetical protein ABIO46_06420 [Chitinophagales bacterium]
MVADETGNLFIGGSYLEMLLINGSDSLLNTGNGYDINTFLFNADGKLAWKRNVTLQHPGYMHIDVMTLDVLDNLWVW